MHQQKFTALLGVVTLFLIIVPNVHAATVSRFVEKDPGYNSDAPNSADKTKNAITLAPGFYGTAFISDTSQKKVYAGPALTSNKDVDFYKFTVQRGVFAHFKLIPQNGQNVWMSLYDDQGKPLTHLAHDENNNDYPRYIPYMVDNGAAGFPEQLDYIYGISVSREKDGIETLYLKIGGGIGRYSLDYKEENKPDGDWTVDAPAKPIDAPRLKWGKTYQGFLGYSDRVDCYGFDPAPAVGDKATITVRPDADLNTRINPIFDVSPSTYFPSASLFDPDGQPLIWWQLGKTKSNDVVKIGSASYDWSTRILNFQNGSAGFQDQLTIYPYYATVENQFSGNSSYRIGFVCPVLINGAGNYTITVTHEKVDSAPAVALSIAGLTLPGGPSSAPVPPTIRDYKTPIYIIELLPRSTKGVPGVKAMPDFKIGDIIATKYRDAVKEKQAKIIFKQFYKRAAKSTKADKLATDIIAYDLYPKKANAVLEKSAKARFTSVIGKDPVTIFDNALIRAIVYSGVKK